MEATHIMSNPWSGKLGPLNKVDDEDDDNDVHLAAKQSHFMSHQIVTSFLT